MAPPSDVSDMKLTLGDIERKVDMSLDDIIKQSRQQKRKVKNSPHGQSGANGQPSSHIEHENILPGKPSQQRRERRQKRGLQGTNTEQRQDVLQRFVAKRSSAVRQGKLAEARAPNNNYMFSATKLAAQRALSSNANVPINRFSRKYVQGVARPAGVATINVKPMGSSQLNKTGGTSRAGVRWTFPVRNGVTQSQRWISNKGNGMMRPQTLDSRFASLREERQLRSQHGPHRGRR